MLRGEGSRSGRVRRRSALRLFAIGSSAFIVLGTAIALLTPADEERPVVVVYMPADCDTCLAWMSYLNRNGFRARAGDAERWEQVRSQVPLSPELRAPHTALVEGFFIEGHVPAREIHQLLRWRPAAVVKGLAVLGVPAGAPGLNTAFPQPYTVYHVHDSGVMESVASYNHVPHL